ESWCRGKSQTRINGRLLRMHRGRNKKSDTQQKDECRKDRNFVSVTHEKPITNNSQFKIRYGGHAYAPPVPTAHDFAHATFEQQYGRSGSEPHAGKKQFCARSVTPDSATG